MTNPIDPISYNSGIEGEAYIVTQDGEPVSMWLTKSAATKVRDGYRRNVPEGRFDMAVVSFRSLHRPEPQTAPDGYRTIPISLLSALIADAECLCDHSRLTNDGVKSCRNDIAMAKAYLGGSTPLAAPADAERLALAERIEANADRVLWCVHVIGPDDLYAEPSHAAAVAAAAKLNAALWSRPNVPEDVTCFAYPDVWPWSKEDHDESLRKQLEEDAARLPSAPHTDKER